MSHFPLRKPLKHPVVQPDRCQRWPTPHVPGRRWAHTCHPHPPPVPQSSRHPNTCHFWVGNTASNPWCRPPCPSSAPGHTPGSACAPPVTQFRGVPGVNPTDAPRAHHVPLILELIPVRFGPWSLLGCFFFFFWWWVCLFWGAF